MRLYQCRTSIIIQYIKNKNKNIYLSQNFKKQKIKDYHSSSVPFGKTKYHFFFSPKLIVLQAL